jgi:hypothetical protein
LSTATAFEALIAAGEQIKAAAEVLEVALADAKAKLARVNELRDLAQEGYFEHSVLATHEPGLSAAEALMVTTLRKAKGRVVTYEALAALGARGDLADGGPDPKVASVRLSNIKKKRPDLREKLQAVHGLGIRWAA